MDTFTRNYSIALVVIGAILLFRLFYEPPGVSLLNDRLADNAELAAYPYRFRVLTLEEGVASMSTPRSAEFPVYRALPLLFPELRDEAPDSRRQRHVEVAPHRYRVDLGVIRRGGGDGGLRRAGQQAADARLRQLLDQQQHLPRTAVEMPAGFDVEDLHPTACTGVRVDATVGGRLRVCVATEGEYSQALRAKHGPGAGHVASPSCGSDLAGIW